METKDKERCHCHHFVLVHGMCHGAWSWCWYKAATLLRRAGHRVSALDMAGCGAHPARLAKVRTFEDYLLPLLDKMAALPPGERVVLVALAAERFTEKVAAAVFVAASMPAVSRPMAATSDELLAFLGPDFFVDSEELEQVNPEIMGKSFLMGPNFMTVKLYHLSPPEDLTLGLMLIRPANAFTTNNPDEVVMRDDKLLTKERYGLARRVFVVVEWRTTTASQPSSNAAWLRRAPVSRSKRWQEQITWPCSRGQRYMDCQQVHEQLMEQDYLLYQLNRHCLVKIHSEIKLTLME